MATFRNAMRKFGSTPIRLNTVDNPPNPKDYETSKKVWRNLTLFVAFPAIGICMVNCYLGEMEHRKQPRPEYIPYEHLNIRKVKFPWGDGNRSLFHNPKTNALPDGYEDEA